MKYKPKQYAEALYEAMEGAKKGEEKQLVEHFVQTVKKNKDWIRLPLILKHFEKIFVEKNGLTKVEVESAYPLTAKTRKEIEGIFKDKVLLEEKVNPRLIAGIRILLNNSVFIDSSALKHINNLFINA
ncbi:MAG: F0F1 ATP synthase subunit delta [Candidatus Pacebacteria bacterium]|nr:F0F1 ATP synthase subunit delta [Candidatus Paceibacterota bacterium]